MEHIIVTERPDNYCQLRAEKGYKLYNKSTRMFFSDAIVLKSDLNKWVAVQK